ncbi:MAG: hypothetical protein IIZ46_04220 [Clostridia bacterium]|nr:hypothetical protein [Clostridia bacterium]
MTKNEQCPYCGAHEFTTISGRFNTSSGVMPLDNKSLEVYYVTCIKCGTVARTYFKNIARNESNTPKVKLL